MLQIKVNETGMKIPKVEYELYYPFNGENLVKLNLTVCEEMEIEVANPVNIKEKDLDKHNSKSSYYRDICYIASSDKGTDIILSDRKKEFIEKNYTPSISHHTSALSPHTSSIIHQTSAIICHSLLSRRHFKWHKKIND